MADPHTLCPTGRTLDQCIEQMTLMKAAPALLIAARLAKLHLKRERDSHFDCARNQSTNEVDDPHEAEILAEYDGTIETLADAIAAAEGRA